MLLSVCMIIKNEELTLRKCLTPLVSIADEIVVVDTGSTDGSIAIAQEFGCRIVRHAWQNDFSDARNAGIKKAKGDWILVVDSDEFLEPLDAGAFRSFLETTNAEGVFILVKSLMGNLAQPSNTLAIRVMRLFRNRHLYEGVIHEQIATSVFATGLPTEKYELSFIHIGYTDEFLVNKMQSHRNVTLIERAMEKDPNDLFHLTNLMAEYSMAGDFEKCVVLSERAWNKIKKMSKDEVPNFTPRILTVLVVSLWETKQKQRAFTYVKEAIRYFPWFTDFQKRYADMLLEEQQFEQAIPVINQARKQGDTTMGLVEFQEGAGTFLAAYDLGIAWTNLGDDMLARKWFITSFFENPTLDTVLFAIIGSLPKDVTLLRDYIEPRLVGGKAWGTYAEIYAGHLLPDAQAIIDKVEKQYGHSESTHRARMSLLRRRGSAVMQKQAEQSKYDIDWLLVGIHALNIGDNQLSSYALKKALVRGEYLLQVQSSLAHSEQATWNIQGVARDVMAVKANRLLESWLPRAADFENVWVTLKHSPVSDVFEKVTWTNQTIHQCEQNAINAFQRREFSDAARFIREARRFGRTVTQYLVECDVALAHSQIDVARKIIYEGKKRFPESLMLKHASEQIHEKSSPMTVLEGGQKGVSLQ